MQIRDYMTEDPFFTTPEQTIGEAVSMMLQRHVRHLPVLRGGALVGMLSERDVRTAIGLPDTNKLLEDPERLLGLLSQPVSDLMSPRVISATFDRDLGECLDLMLEHHIGALPIVDAAGDRLVGIFTYVDGLRALRQLVAPESSAQG